LIVTFSASLVIGLAFASAVAQSGTPPTGNSTSTEDPNRVICRVERETGSLLNRRRVCMTQAQWDDAARQLRQNIDHAQTSRVNQGGQ
jgi:hypothetical protein